MHIQLGERLDQLIEQVEQQLISLAGGIPGHFHVAPGRQGAGGGLNAHLLAVIADRLAFAQGLEKPVDRLEELGQVVLEAKTEVGEALHGLVQGGEIGWAQQVAREGEQPAERTGARSAHFAQQALQVALADAEAERGGGGGFQVVAFVDDQVIIFWQHAAARDHVGEQQGVVDH